MPREIKTTLAVDGEQAFKRAINDARTSMRNLGTQLTLATAEFKKDGDAMKLMETRSKTLKAEITQQEEIVKALETAVEESTKAYGENSDKTEKWQAELNRAKASLTNLQSELALNDVGLDRNGNSFDTSSQKAADYQATLQTIGKNVSFETVTKGIGGITAKVENAIQKIIELGQKAVEVMRESAQWADDLTTQAIVNGLSLEEQQRMEYASKFADTDVDTIIHARDKLGEKMVNGWTEGSGKDKLNIWDLLGIDIRDAETGNWRNTMDVLWDLGETLMNMTIIDGNDVRANEYAMEAFGKRWRELLPLFQYGKEAFNQKMSEAPIVDDEDIEKLTSLNDKFDEFDSRLKKLKETALAQLAPALEGIVGSINEMLAQFSEWLETPEGKQAMSELSEAIAELFSGLKNVDFKDAINKVKDAINGIKDALVWLSEHKDDVYSALKVIGAGFALLKVSDTVLKVLQLKNGLSGLTGGSGNQMDQSQAGRPGGDYNYQPGTPTTDGTGTRTGWFAGMLNNMVTGAGVNFALNEYHRISQSLEDEIAGMSVEEARRYGGAKTLGMTVDEYDAWQAANSTGTSGGHSFDVPTAAPAYTEAQRAAAEEFWDAYRSSPDEEERWSDSFDRLEETFGGNQEAFDQLMDSINLWEQRNNEDNSVYGVEDLPQELWDAGDQIGSVVGETLQNMTGGAALPSGGDIQAFRAVPGQMEAAVRTAIASGMSGIRVTMDGETVGALILPYINTGLGGLVG